MRYLLIAAIAFLLGIGTFFAFYLLTPSPAPVAPPILAEAQTRTAREVPTVKFTDVTREAQLDFRFFNGMTGQKLLPETMGGGVAVIDFNVDGRPDLFFVNSCPWPGHEVENPKVLPKLYENLGNGTFRDVSEAFGFTRPMYGMGATVGDYDNDGFPDLFVSGVGQNRLFHNESGQSFRDVTSEAGVGGSSGLPQVSWEAFLKWDKPIPFGTSATFVDYDCDGRLDLFVCSYVSWSPAIDLSINSTTTGVGRSFGQPRDFNGSQCWLYRNLDGKTFADVSESAGVIVTEKEGRNENDRIRAVAKSLGVIVCDADDDGWPDLVVANDTVRNFYFHNEAGPDGTRVYREIGVMVGAAYPDDGKPRGGMGIDWGEYRPGKSGIVVANFAQEPVTFLNRTLKDERTRFTDVALPVGLSAPSRQALKFGTVFFDYDLDGRLDLFMTNGHIEPEIAKIQGGQSYKQSPQLYWNTGEEKPVFEPVPEAQCGTDLMQPLVGRGCAYLDYDGDGDLDLVIVDNGGQARLLRNDLPKGPHFIRLALEGTNSNRSAIGARITIKAGDTTLERAVAGAKGYLSQSEFPVTIGLGEATAVDNVTVRWPGKDHKTQEWTNLSADRTYRLREGDPEAKFELKK